jgi:hypothetical protein
MSTSVSTTTLVATANVLDALDRGAARAAVEAVLAQEPDLVGLQEWGCSRRSLLPQDDYAWFTPLYGGNPVGARRDRFTLLGARVRLLAGIGRSDRGARPVPVLPPRVATVARLQDRLHDRTVSLVDFHLVPGAQAQGRYRADRPLLAARHAQEVRRLQGLVRDQLAAGHVTYAVGDSNFHGFLLPGLTSAWEGRDDAPGTLGSTRRVDDVFGPGPAVTVTLLATASDHRAVLADRPDQP